MRLFRRRRAAGSPVAGPSGRGRGGFSPGDRQHLEGFLATRRGVQAYIEPATNVTPCTIVLVAHDGEWTRRPCGDPEAASTFASRASIPVYDVGATGYPPRMREWSAAAKRAGQHERRTSQRPRPSDAEMPPDPFL